MIVIVSCSVVCCCSAHDNVFIIFFFFNDTATTEIYTLSLHDALPISSHLCSGYGFAMGDLYENRPERKKEWKKRFGEIDVKFIDDLELTEDELLIRNKAYYKKRWNKIT